MTGKRQQCKQSGATYLVESLKRIEHVIDVSTGKIRLIIIGIKSGIKYSLKQTSRNLGLKAFTSRRYKIVQKDKIVQKIN